MAKTHPPYAPEFRRQMVELVRSGRSAGELAREFGCCAQTIRNWVRQSGPDEVRRDDSLTSSEFEELRRLRRENRRLRREHASPLRAALEAEHYIDEESIRDAVRHESSFNLVHYGTGLKIDVFIAADTEYEAGVRTRRVSEPIGAGADTRHLWIASAEDTILAKLAWYR